MANAALSSNLAHAREEGALLSAPTNMSIPMRENSLGLSGDFGALKCPVDKSFLTTTLLSEAVDLALCNSPQVQSTLAAIEIQYGIQGEARSLYFPTMSMNLGSAKNNKEDDAVGPSMSWNGVARSATLNWRLFDFGGRQASNKNADMLLAASLAEHDAGLQKLVANVIQYYFDAQSAKAIFIGKEQAETYAKKTFLAAQRKADRGAASEGDLLLANMALIKATIEKSRANDAYKKALAVLVFTLGVPAQTQITVSDIDMTPMEVGENQSLDAWLQVAQKSHPAIRAAHLKYEAAKQKVLAVRSEALPIIDFSINYSKMACLL